MPNRPAGCWHFSNCHRDRRRIHSRIVAAAQRVIVYAGSQFRCSCDEEPMVGCDNKEH